MVLRKVLLFKELHNFKILALSEKKDLSLAVHRQKT
jgi:hypothetical protein